MNQLKDYMLEAGIAGSIGAFIFCILEIIGYARFDINILLAIPFMFIFSGLFFGIFFYWFLEDKK